MVIRTNDEAIRGSIQTLANINLAPFIRRANALTNRVAANDADGVLSSAILLEIETLLACHYYERRDHAYAEKATGKASAKFQGTYGMGLMGTKWGQDAVELDETGFLRGLTQGVPTADVEWVGLPPTEQTDYIDRR